MKRCAVCGKEVGVFSSEVVKGASGEYVCRECLSKAKTSVSKYQYFRIYSSQIRNKIENGAPIQAKLGSQATGAIIAIVVVLFFFVFIISICTRGGTSSSNDAGTNSYENTQNYAETVDESEQPKLVITNAYITTDDIGQIIINLTVENNGDYTIDAFDYTVQAYNNYGEKISSSLLDDFTAPDITLKSGAKTTRKTVVPLVSGATSFKVAINRYHIADTDETISISSKNRAWYGVSK